MPVLTFFDVWQVTMNISEKSRQTGDSQEGGPETPIFRRLGTRGRLIKGQVLYHLQDIITCALKPAVFGP